MLDRPRLFWIEKKNIFEKKIMFSAFLSMALSKWWDFNETQFPEIERNSSITPVFMITTITKCPYCVGLPQLLKTFSETVGAKSNVIYTHVDCWKTKICQRIGVRGVPAFYLIRGSNPRYWVQEHGRNPINWISFLETHTRNLVLSGNFTKAEELSKSITDGSLFYLETSNIHLIKKFKQMSIKYEMYGCKFVLNTNESIKNSSLYTFVAPSISILTYPAHTNLENLMETNKFGPFHDFDSNELSNRSNPLILVVSKELSQLEKNNILNATALMRNKIVNEGYRIGFSSSTRKDIQKILKIDENTSITAFSYNSSMPFNKYSAKLCEAIISGQLFAQPSGKNYMYIAGIALTFCVTGLGIFLWNYFLERKELEKLE